MKPNLGVLDRILRLIFSVAMIGLFITGITSGILGYILLVIGIMIGITGLIGYCGLYTMLGISTCSKKKKK